MGDAIYEIYVRDHLINQGETKPNKLHRAATNYVSANAQAFLIQQMLEEHLLTEEEELYYRRGRNAKSHTSAKNADVTTYRVATGFEADGLSAFDKTNRADGRIDPLVYSESW